MKKLLAIVTVIAMLASMLTFGVSAGGDAVEVADATNFAEIFSAGLQTAPSNYVLTDDIVLTPDKDNHYFKIMEGSTFDGNGHTITIEKDTLNGLFEILPDADTENVAKTTFKNINIGTATAPEQVGMGVFLRIEDDNGSVLGINKYIDVEWNNINVYVKFKAETNNNHGAFISNNAWGDHVFKNCYVNVTSDDTATAYGSSVGGFIGRCKGGTYTFTDCVVEGTISANATAGGFIAKCAGEGAPVATFNNCVNKANITTVANGTIAGFVANFDQAGTSVTVNNCVNYGFLGNSTTGNKVAGILGDGGQNGTAVLTNSMNVGTITSAGNANAAGIIFKANSTIDGCVNIGDIYGNVWGSGSLAGGIVTGGAVASMTNCYSFGQIYKVNATPQPTLMSYVLTAKSGGATVTTASGNKYIAYNNVTDPIDTSAATVASVDAAIAELEKTAFGNLDFTNNAGKIEVVDRGAVAVVGAQMNEAKNAIRVVGVIDSLNYASAGFKYVINSTQTGTASFSGVYGSVCAESATSDVTTITSAQLGGRYVTALVIKGVAAGDVITITAVAGSQEYNTITFTVGAGGTLSAVNA